MRPEPLVFPPPDDDVDLLVRWDNDVSTVRITVSGEVDSISCGVLRRTFTGAVQEHRPAVVEMDVAGVTFLDSAGIRALVECRAEAAQAGCTLVLTMVPRIVHRVLEISGLLEHFGMPTELPAGQRRL